MIMNVVLNFLGLVLFLFCMIFVFDVRYIGFCENLLMFIFVLFRGEFLNDLGEF